MKVKKHHKAQQSKSRVWLIIAIIGAGALILPVTAQNTSEAVNAPEEATGTTTAPPEEPIASTTPPRLPIAEDAGREIDARIFAYSSTVDQTDSDPFTMASGRKVFWGAVANNCLPFGTVVIIHGERFEVWDRMNERYGCGDFDIWYPTRASALTWGTRFCPITIL